MVLLTADELLRQPYSLIPLDNNTKKSLYGVGSLALLSVVSTSILLIWITFRMIFWRRYYRTYVGYNQNIILIYQLLLADLQQSLGFVLSFHWLSEGKLVGPSAACFTQAWFIHIGDVSSGFFVLLIALHTWWSVVRGKRIPYNYFLMMIVATWGLSLFLTILGPALHGRNIFLRAGSWCWISSNHETSRLTLHYLWIFIDEFGSVILYALVFWHLRAQVKDLIQSKIISKATRCMVLYPLAYVILTLPLATGRMSAMSGNPFPEDYIIAAGALITSCGWVDCLLYTMTRRVLISSEIERSTENPKSRSHGNPGGLGYFSHYNGGTQRQVTITRSRRQSNGNDSTDSIISDAMRLGNIKAETRVEVVIENVAAERKGSPETTADATSESDSFHAYRSNTFHATATKPAGGV